MNATKSPSRAIADVSQGLILAVVDIEVPPERVFRALTDPDEMKLWWGSADTYRITESTMDLRVGGRWRSSGRGTAGEAFTVEGEYLEIDPPRRLVQTWKPDWDGGHVTTIHYLLEPISTGTRVTVRHEGFAGRPESCQGHAQGWERVLGWLADHVSPPNSATATATTTTATPTQPASDSFFLCRLLAPRPTFAQDMTPDEQKIMQAHAGYWQGLLGQGTAIVFGPVLDPRGSWGVGIVRARSEADVRLLERNDPVILSGRGFSYEILPMMRAVFRQ